MTLLAFFILLLLGAFSAGLLGSLTGLGGGVIIIPLLTLAFGVDIRYAIGAALIASIATSSGSAAAYVREGFANIRIGMFLEIATTTGAVCGAVLAAYVSTSVVAVLFGLVLIFSAIMSFRKKHPHPVIAKAGPLGRFFHLSGSYPEGDEMVPYAAHNVAGGYLIMTIAGILSGLLGIGSGALKVLAMDSTMKLPFKVSTTTSNFMIGVTAAASAVIYMQRGYIDPGIALPVVIGVLSGALVGSKILVKANTALLRKIFGVVILFLAFQMIYNGLSGRL